jgi:hypothetical protein
MKVYFVPVAAAYRLTPKVSYAAIVVLDRSVRVVLWMRVPDASENPEVLSVLLTVGKAVPPSATRQSLIVAVPASAVIVQSVTVQA